MEQIEKNEQTFFLIPKKYWAAIEMLKPKEQQTIAWAIMKYGATGEMDIENYPPTVKCILSLFKSDFDGATAIYQKKMARSAVNQENGAKGGRPKKAETKTETETETKPNENQTETEKKPKENQIKTETKPNENQTETEKKPIIYNNNNIYNNKRESIERKPTLAEVEDFCKKEKLSFSPRKFFQHYESVGWDRVVDWQAKARLWQIQDDEKAAPPQTTKLLTYDEVQTLAVSGKARFEDFDRIPKPDGGKGFLYKLKTA